MKQEKKQKFLKFHFNKSWLFVVISHPTKKIPIPKVKNPENIPNNRDKNPKFRGINPETKKFHSGFFRDLQIPIPGISGFFDLAQNKKSRSRFPEIGIRDLGSGKNPMPKPTLIFNGLSIKSPTQIL